VPRWWGWGSLDTSYSAEEHPGLGPFLSAHIGPPFRGYAVPALESLSLPAPTSGFLSQVFSGVLSKQDIRIDRLSRVGHALGKSYTDLMRIRTNTIAHAPEAVLFPRTIEQVELILDTCERESLAVIPFGGGTSVTGALDAEQEPTISLDLENLQGLSGLDEVSHLATFGAGTLGPKLEEALASRGFTLGHFPQSFEYSTLGGWLASRSAGQNSIGYGRIEDAVFHLEAVTPRGRLSMGRGPASASGPSLKDLFLGGEGAFGVIVSATLRVRPLPAKKDYRAYFFHSFEEGVEAVRELLQTGPKPSLARLSDACETQAGLALSGGPHGAGSQLVRKVGLRLVETLGYEPGHTSLLLLGYEGGEREVEDGGSRAMRVCKARGAFDLGHSPAKEWLAERFLHPYLRDLLMDWGVMVDTFETATSWSNLVPLHAQLTGSARQALGHGFVMCHLSHAYETGASLYFTFFAAQDLRDPFEQWDRVKKEVTDQIMKGGATLTHHHGIGRFHRPWLEGEIGARGLDGLQAMKRALDPAGIMNPGVLWRPS